MKVQNIPAYEADFRAKGVDADGKRFTLTPFQVDIPGTAEKVEGLACKRADGVTSYYYGDAQPAKERIVVHFTAGYLKGDISALTKTGNHVSTPFVVARDGTIYQLFSSKLWSYHLGKGAQGDNERMSKSSIAIELSNVGYLTPKDGTFLDPYGELYCTADQTDAYVKLAQPFRKHSYYATFPDAQYRSLIKLLRYLTATYNIPPTFLPEANRYDVYPGVAQFRGITTHVNYQPESYGKWDIGPAFDWARVMGALNPGAAIPAVTPAAPTTA
jgi:N-acetyl-anhydromuramyl-L-alanine amidase AmpD